LDLRTREEAGDNIKIFDYLKNEVNKLFTNSQGAFLLALPTMPLRTSRHINEAFELFKSTGKAVFSAVEYDFSTTFAFSISDNNTWSPLFENSPMVTGNTRCQDQKLAYHPNGAIYIRMIDDLRRKKLPTLYTDAITYIMNRNESVDIDTINDFKIADILIKN
jgi:CMP-N,N'-diacetyllegionaminic acid synthase